MMRFIVHLGLSFMDMQGRDGEKKEFSLGSVVAGKMKKKKKEDEGRGLLNGFESSCGPH